MIRLTFFQVLVSFVATAYISTVIMVLYYIFEFNPELDPFRLDHKETPIVIAPASLQPHEHPTFKPNPVDIFVVKYPFFIFRAHIPPISQSKRTRLSTAFNQVWKTHQDSKTVMKDANPLPIRSASSL